MYNVKYLFMPIVCISINIVMHYVNFLETGAKASMSFSIGFGLMSGIAIGLIFGLIS